MNASVTSKDSKRLKDFLALPLVSKRRNDGIWHSDWDFSVFIKPKTFQSYSKFIVDIFG
jgi:hypothetical protein